MPIFHWAVSRDGHSGLFRALAISLVLHLLLFWAVKPQWQPAAQGTPLTASLQPAAKPATTEQKRNPEPEPSRPETRSTEPAPIAKTPVPPTPIVVPAGKLPTAEPPKALTTAEAGGSPATTPAPVDVAAKAAPAGVAVAPTADSLGAYRQALVEQVRRHKRYPRLAIEAGWTGTVHLGVTVGATGTTQVEVRKSSGYPRLDETALEMLAKALPETKIPAPLRGREFVVELPVVFDLPD